MHRYGRIFGMIQFSVLAALGRAQFSGVLVSIVVRRLFRPLFILTEYICLSRRRPGHRTPHARSGIQFPDGELFLLFFTPSRHASHVEGVSEEFDVAARLPSYGRQMSRLDRVEGASSSRIPLGHRGHRAGAVEVPRYDEVTGKELS